MRGTVYFSVFFALIVIVRASQAAPATLNTTIEECIIQESPYLIETVVDVFYAEAALFKASLGDILSLVNIYHGGIIYRVRNKEDEINTTCQEVTIEYVGTPTVFASLVPDSINDTSKEINWNYGGEIGMNTTTAEDYWNKQTFVARIDTLAFDKLVCWVPTVGNQPYQLFQVFSKGANESAYFTQVLWSTTCVDFCWDQLNVLYNIGMTVYDSPPIGRTNVKLYALDTWNVTLNSTNFGDIAEYYVLLKEFLSGKALNESFEDLLMEFVDFASNRTIWVHVKDDQYMGLNVSWPYVSISYDYADATSDAVPNPDSIETYSLIDACSYIIRREADIIQWVSVYLSTALTIIVVFLTFLFCVLLTIGLIVYLIIVLIQGQRKKLVRHRGSISINDDENEEDFYEEATGSV